MSASKTVVHEETSWVEFCDTLRKQGMWKSMVEEHANQYQEARSEGAEAQGPADNAIRPAGTTWVDVCDALRKAGSAPGGEAAAR